MIMIASTQSSMSSLEVVDDHNLLWVLSPKLGGFIPRLWKKIELLV